MGLSRIETVVRVPEASAMIVHYDMEPSSDHVFCNEDLHWLELSLTPRIGARARHLPEWRFHQFRPIGAIMMVPQGHSFQFRSDGGTMAAVVCQINDYLLHKWHQDGIIWTERRLESGLDLNCSGIRNLLIRLFQELDKPGLARDAIVELIIGQLVIELIRHFNGVGETRPQGGLAPWRLRIIEDRLTASGVPPSLVELAALCDLSVRQLTRGFRASQGCTLGDYIALRRAETAKELLKQDIPLKQITHAMGYASRSSFSYAFRNSTGMNPSEFRRAVSFSRCIKRSEDLNHGDRTSCHWSTEK